MIADQSRANSGNLVCADRRSDAAAAHRDAAIHFAGCHGLRERDDKIGIIVCRFQAVRAIIGDVVPGTSEAGHQTFLQFIPAVIGGDSYTQRAPPSMTARWLRAASPSASTVACSPRMRPAGIARSPVTTRLTMGAFSAPVTTHRTRRARLRTG